MNDLTKFLSNQIQNIYAFTKQTASNHKKKLVIFVLVIISGYIAKKTITLAHIIRILQSLSKLVQYLPLPQAPKLRQIAPYQIGKRSPLKNILQAIKLEEIRSKIGKKEASYEQLKSSIVIGTIVTLNIYNINSFYFTIQNKYSQDFLQLQASTQFDEAMYLIRKKFLEEIPIFFEYFRQLLFHQISLIDLLKVYTIKQFQQLFQKLNRKIFQKKMNKKIQIKSSKIQQIDVDSKNRFTTHYQYQENTTNSKIGIAFNFISKCLYSVFNVFNLNQLFPDPKIQLTEERYQFIKQVYILSLKKTQLQHISWPNTKAKNLFNLLIEEIHYTLLSTNFSILVKEYSRYNTTLLINRIILFFNLKKKESFKFGQFLPGLYKILQQQFLKVDQEDLRQKFHDSQVKKAIRYISQNQNVELVELQVPQSQGIQQRILQQIEMKSSFKYLERQFELKYFNERSGMVYHVKKGEPENGGKEIPQGKNMSTFLQMVSQMKGLNQTQ